MDAYIEEIDSIATNAVWNGNSLMTSANQTISIQAGAASADTISIGFEKTTTTTLFASHLSSSTLNISTTAAAGNAVDYIDTALDPSMLTKVIWGPCPM
jgi:flagellin